MSQTESAEDDRSSQILISSSMTTKSHDCHVAHPSQPKRMWNSLNTHQLTEPELRPKDVFCGNLRRHSPRRISCQRPVKEAAPETKGVWLQASVLKHWVICHEKLVVVLDDSSSRKIIPSLNQTTQSISAINDQTTQSISDVSA